MSADFAIRLVLGLVCVAFFVRAAAAICSDAAKGWYERRADIGRYNAGDAAPELPEKPWYVRLHEWGLR